MTCHELRAKGISSSGLYDLSSPGNIPIPCYCDFDSENGSSWTLIESFSLANNAQFRNLTFSHPHHVIKQNQPNGEAYSMSNRRIKLIRTFSTHWRSTCNYFTEGVVYTDYVRARLEENDLLVNAGGINGSCAKYDFISIRGGTCANCTALTFHQNHFHIDSYSDACEFDGRSHGAYEGEDNFGFYSVINPAFRCTTFQNSTTQFWIGNL